MGNRTDGAGLHFQSKHIKINIQKDFSCVYVCVCARLLMLDNIFQRLILSHFCICASGKKKQKEKCSVYSARASPLLTHSCLMLGDHAAFKKGV